MDVLRQFLRAHARISLLLVVAVLAIRALVPAGYMLDARSQVLTVHICADATGGDLVKQLTIPVSGKTGEADFAKSGMACPCSSMSMALLAVTPVALLLSALAFILALGFVPVRTPLLHQPRFLRPLLRGPPAVA